MDLPYPTLDTPATPEYVLAVLRDQHQQYCNLGDADPTIDLSFQMPVADWLQAWEAAGIADFELGRTLNQEWRIACSEEQWQAVLNPPRERLLWEVCDLIARHTVQPGIRPARLFGCTCAPAGAFLTIRSLLHQAGVPIENLAPSTPLSPFALRHLEVFLGPIARLAPGWLPPVRIFRPVQTAAFLGILIAAIGFFIGQCLGSIPLQLGGCLDATLYTTVAFWAGWRRWRERIEFGPLQTFRDLAVVVAEGNGAFLDAPSPITNH